MEYRITIWHNLEDREFADSMCDILRQNNIPNLSIEWIKSRFFSANALRPEKGLFYVDIQMPDNVEAEDICRELLIKNPDIFTYAMIESSCPCSWKERFEKSRNNKQSGKHIEVKIDKSFSKPLPFSEYMLCIADQNCHFEGGILINEKFVDDRYHEIENNLLQLGFDQISHHNVQKDCYKIDFNANIIRGTTLISNGWFCDELRNWRLPNYNAKMVYPNSHQLHRNADWYHNEIEWRVVEIKQDAFFDCSDDDLSQNPAFW